MATKMDLRACAFLLLAIAATVPLESAPAAAQMDSEAGWQFCAIENSMCQGRLFFDDSIATVSYGYWTNFVHFAFLSGAAIKAAPLPCNNQQFGTTNFNAFTQICATSTGSIGIQPPSGDAGWVQVAKEGETFSINQPNVGFWIRYGAGKRWYYQFITQPNASREYRNICNQIAMANGYDPFYGTEKTCQYSNGSIIHPLQLAKCANEYGTCELTPGAKLSLVRYQSQDQQAWQNVTKVVSGIATRCWSEFFGIDPTPGQGKECLQARLR